MKVSFSNVWGGMLRLLFFVGVLGREWMIGCSNKCKLIINSVIVIRCIWREMLREVIRLEFFVFIIVLRLNILW